MFAPVASDVPSVLSDNPKPGIPFEDVLGQIAQRHYLALPDKIVPLASLRATEDGLIEVPDHGRLSLTAWSRQRLANLLGIRWDRWFASESIAPTDRALEINRRFRASADHLKVRARRQSASETAPGDGILRAFVTPTYGPIDDLEVFESMGRSLAGRLDGFRFIRQDVTCESSQYAAVCLEEIDLGTGKQDRHRNGFLVANSEVGSRSLGILVWVWRLVCSNGLVAPDSRIFRLVHRQRKNTSMGRNLEGAFGLMPENWKRAETVLRNARRDALADPRLALELLIKARAELRPLSESILAAFEADPEPTRFGLVQALTRAAQSVSPERRLAVEEMAGQVAAAGPTLEVMR